MQLKKLEKPGLSYRIKIIYHPKFHSELATIKGFWCSLKNFVRKRSEQNFSKMISLIKEARLNFEVKQLDRKLQRRFWKKLHNYSSGQNYKQILGLFSHSLCIDKVISHRKITHANVEE